MFSLTTFDSSADPPPDLPSVPTRRSSDLRGFAGHHHKSSVVSVITASGKSQESIAIAASAAMGFAFDARSPGRSEEHTSELQSRGHLVCRLLLEKKKIYLYK